MAKVALVETDSTEPRRPGTHEGSGFEWVFIGCDVLVYGDVHGISWMLMDFSGCSWVFMDFNGCESVFMCLMLERL